MRRISVSALGLSMLIPSTAVAHPHVWVNVTSALHYNPQGEVMGVRHAWTFDEAYSAFAVQGLDKNNDGVYAREELADLAKVNVESLVDFAYFTFLKMDGKQQSFDAPKDYHLEYDKKQMTLHFTLPLKDAQKSKQAVGLEIYDPTYFVSFTLKETDDAVKVVDAPKGCTVKISRPTPDPKVQEMLAQLSQDVSLEGTEFGVQMATKTLIVCP